VSVATPLHIALGPLPEQFETIELDPRNVPEVESRKNCALPAGTAMPPRPVAATVAVRVAALVGRILSTLDLSAVLLAKGAVGAFHLSIRLAMLKLPRPVALS